MTKILILAAQLRAYIAGHRKALAAAVAVAVTAYGAQIAEGATVIDWRRLAIAVVLGIAGGGTVHVTTNTP